MEVREPLDIIVGIPSFNEEDSISNVVKKVDKCLTKFFPKYKSLIVNVDESTDQTKQAFLKTRTKIPKKYFYVGPETGKGRNLIKLLKYSIESKAKLICTIDADVKSIKEDWVYKMLHPIIKREADFVLPLYARNRYEANSTNHFFVPLIKAFFNLDIRQPIAGEYAMSLDTAKYIMSRKMNPEVKNYGIDPFLTINAIGGGFKVKEVHLGEKIHKPSFGKMVPMFQQMCATALFSLNFYKNQKFPENNGRNLKIGISKMDTKPSSKSINDRNRIVRNQLEFLIKEPEEVLVPLKRRILLKILKNNFIDKIMWVELLNDFLTYIIRNNVNATEASRLSRIITPLFLLRVLTYFKEIENLNPKKIENIINYQKKSLNLVFNKIRKKPSHNDKFLLKIKLFKPSSKGINALLSVKGNRCMKDVPEARFRNGKNALCKTES